IGSIIITPERRKHHLFSLPYKASYLQYIVLKNTPFTTISQLAGKRLGVYGHSPTADFAVQQLNGNIQIKRFPGSMDMLYALERGQVDAVLTNHAQTVYWVSNSNAYQLLGHKYLFEDGYGIMTSLGQNALIQRVNQALLAMEQDGTYLKIYQDSF
ncbi:MAG: transporter substrate-binding domain-containing protein, partial [Methylococcales bacterium]|nr:transporter substrate-binding domain-containing protein [Methylococcales bacterium]